ncbi:hypothetical protein AAFF_G00389610 [Aldrovandia affinis]|uniref:Docking protein 2 n=1 Tax=Aldrovandia affinis TaxID=143900 RepID=A0AAD7SEB2_9TELE|nr:hypothetical protein AAFF_G00389610 [Aldrovandia affinis]
MQCVQEVRLTGNSTPLCRLQSPQAPLSVWQGYRRLDGASRGQATKEESARAMEEDVGKKGQLYIQQQRFGKKWKKVWSVIYRESTCSISRMEFFEFKDCAGSLERPDRTMRKPEHKKVIRLSDCIRVSEVEVDSCPRDCGPFLVETTEKLFLFAAELAELDDWIQKLCEIAFPMNWAERGVHSRGSFQRAHSRGNPAETAMEDNSLYGRRDWVLKDFKVGVRKTEASERCRMRGPFILRADFDSLILMDQKAAEVLFTWPYRFLRRFGRDKVTFSFEAGRRCDTGEGNFEFDTKQGNGLFQAVETAINMQKSTFTPHRQASGGADALEPAPMPPVAKDSSFYSTINEALVRDGPSPCPGPGPCSAPPQGARSRLDLPPDKTLTGVKSLTLDTRPLPRKSQVKPISSCPLLSGEDQDQAYSQISLSQGSAEEPEGAKAKGPARRGSQDDYSLPFDTISKNLMASLLAALPPMAGGCGGGVGAGPRATRGTTAQTGRRRRTPSTTPSTIRPSARQSRPAPRTPGPPGSSWSTSTTSRRAARSARRPASGPPALYDEPEEVKGQAWKFQGTTTDPGGHEYPYNPNVDDYAVPKPPKRAFPDPQDKRPEAEEDSPYDNVTLKAMDRGNR